MIVFFTENCDLKSSRFTVLYQMNDDSFCIGDVKSSKMMLEPIFGPGTEKRQELFSVGVNVIGKDYLEIMIKLLFII